MHRLSVEHSVQNALQAASVLNEHNADTASLVLRIAEREPDPGQKATLLSGVAHILTEAGRRQEAGEIVLAALSASSRADRDTVMQVLADVATTLASVDDGQLLWKLYLELERMDNWFGV